jgi:peptidoglycan/xylan/chitin deacetylase (PgdA/CDA1 family)
MIRKAAGLGESLNLNSMRNPFLLFLLSILCLAANGQSIQWPRNKKAVIILTYDDGLSSQLNVAIPQLDKHKLKGTFFLDARITEDQIPLWKAVSLKGHELANHSLYHPCSEKAFKSHERLYAENYDVVSILAEIKMMNKFLFMIDGKRERTYAYPCTETSVGGKDYVDSLTSSGLIKYARIGGDENTVITDISALHDMKVPSFAVTQNQDGKALIAYAEKIRQAGGVGILMFHGIGGDYLSVSSEAHEKFLQYLKDHEKEIWITTFKEAMDHISRQAK